MLHCLAQLLNIYVEESCTLEILIIVPVSVVMLFATVVVARELCDVKLVVVIIVEDIVDGVWLSMLRYVMTA